MKNSMVDQFCGAEGLTAGSIDIGLNVRASYDNWTPVLESYARNINKPTSRYNLSDIETAYKNIAELDPDTKCRVPHCQDFSNAGRRVKGERANLTNAFEKNVTRFRQKICNGECSRNVYKRFISADQKMFEEAQYFGSLDGYQSMRCTSI